MVHESKWKAHLVKAFGCALSLHGHGGQAPGWPDIFLATMSYSGWLELKRGTQLSTAQRIIGRKLERFKMFYCVRLLSDDRSAQIENSDGEVLATIADGWDSRALLQVLCNVTKPG